MSYSIFILEDEKHQEELLLDLLRERFPAYQVMGVATTIAEGKAWLEAHTPDLVFMDVMLPPLTSFDLLQSLKQIPFEIIFTTSYDTFAVRAFRLSAIDYLLKPIDPEELARALSKFEQKKSQQQSTKQVHNLLANLNVAQAGHAKIALPTLTGFIFVPVIDIIRIESDNTYTTFFTTDNQKRVVSKTMRECEQVLHEYRFFRIHNSHLISIDHVIEYTKGEGGIVKMADGASLDVARRRKDEFLRLLKKT